MSQVEVATSAVHIKYDRSGLKDEELIFLYKELLKPRLIEEKMLVLLRQGKIAKWFSGIGQEAISVGCGLALNQEEYILPMHRNLGVFTTRKIPLHRRGARGRGGPGGGAGGGGRAGRGGARGGRGGGRI